MTEAPNPVPGQGELLIDVAIADANYPVLLVMESRYYVKLPLPFAPETAASGTVAALGAGIDVFKVGDRVSAKVEYGAFAQRLVAPAQHCVRIPDGIGVHVEAGLGLTDQTAWFALVDRAPGRVAAAQQTILELNRAGSLNAIIDRVLPMSRFAETLNALSDGTVQGKLILDPAA